MTKISPVQKKRKMQLSTFYHKVNLRSRLNTTDYKIKDVLIILNKDKRRVEQSKSIENNFKSLRGPVLFNVIELVIKSGLKNCLIKRSTSKILENKQFQFWHESTKWEMNKLKKHLTKSQIKEYMFDFYHNYDKENLSLHINKYSCLKWLLIAREVYRTDNKKFNNIQNKISQEWIHLTNMFPQTEYVICYALEVLNFLNLHKVTMRNYNDKF